MRALLILAVMVATAHAEDVDLEKWLRARGVMGEIDPLRQPFGCRELVVGKAREAALACVEIEEVSSGGGEYPIVLVVTHQTVNVVRAGKVVVVLDASTRLEPFDGLPGLRALLELQLRLAPDGMSATLEADCQARRGAGFEADLERRMCDARGSYMWAHGRFERRAKSR